MDFSGPIRRATTILAELIDASKVGGWISHGGPTMLFVLLFACGLGLPIPEDIPLMAAGFFIAKGQMNVIAVAIVAWLGIIGGDCVLYRFGHKYGLNITKVPLIGKHFTKDRILKAERLFDRWGIWVVAIGRLITGVRGAMVVAAGAIRFNFIKFLIADGLAALVSGGLFIALGWWLGKQLPDDFDEAADRMKPYIELFIVGLTVVTAAFVFYLWWKHRKHKAATDVALDAAVAVAEKGVLPAAKGVIPAAPTTTTPAVTK